MTTPEPIRLLLAEDHSIVREGLKQLFALTADIVVAAEADEGAKVLAAVQSQAQSFDLLLVDMTMPGISGPELIGDVKMYAPSLPILVLSMHAETQIVYSALKAGASGYLTKDCDPETLLTAIRKIAAGGKFIDPEMAEQMVFKRGISNARPHDILSKREFQILRLLSDGMSVNDVAAELHISNKTVSTHKARLMEKMGFSNNADLVRYAVANKLVG